MAVACGFLAAAVPEVGAAAEPGAPVLDRFFAAWRERNPCRGEPAGSECLTVALASPVRRGDTLTVLVWRTDGGPPKVGALDPELLATGTVVSVSRTPADADLPPPRFRDATLSVRPPLPDRTSDALVAVSGEILGGRVGAVSRLSPSHPDVAAYQRRLGPRVRARWLRPIESKTGKVPEDAVFLTVYRLSAPGKGPTWDFVTFEVPKLGSYGLGVDLSSPKRPVLFEARGLSEVLSITDLDGDGTFELGLTWAPNYYVGDWEVRLFDGARLGRRKVLRTWAD